jgi:hypothetical protein
MKGQWREQYYKKEWTKGVDISILYQMQMVAETLRKYVSAKGALSKTAVTRELELLDKCLAAARGDIVNFDLSKLQILETPLRDPKITQS